MNKPKKVNLREEPDGPVFTYRWGDWGFIILFLFGLVFTLFPIWLIVKNLEYGFMVAFLLVFSAIGFALTYYSLGRMINRTEICLQRGRLVIRQKPLPWRYNADLPTADILAVSQETYYNRGADSGTAGAFTISIESSFRNERLSAIVRTARLDEKAIILIPKLELAAARYLEQEIETRLGLRQAQTGVEKEMALQSAQQEQRRVEASQVKMVIPLLMLVTPLLIIAGIGLLIGNYNSLREARASSSWPSTVAQASGYTIFEHVPDDQDVGYTYYDAYMEYTYSVDGEDLTIKKPVPETFASSEEMEQFVFENYPPGTPLTVYYNPQNPARALYDRSGPGAEGFAVAMVALVFGLLSPVLLLVIGREICRAEGCP
ncbi:MAG: DUF3592 domain-containing protein, partial [Anaerolineales bacterium]|nr:DUF3592 domain-containing protein [Anaerolineales bacterium]